MKLRKQELIDMFEFKTLHATKEFKVRILEKTGRGGGSAARDYIRANCLLSELEKVNAPLSEIKSLEDARKYLNPLTWFKWIYYTPCLAFRYDELKPEDQEKVLTDQNWEATEKMNGCRIWLCYYKGEFRLFSRNYSEEDCSLHDYSKNIAVEPKKVDDIAVFDCEIMFEPGCSIKDMLDDLGLETESKLEAMCVLLQTYPDTAKAIQNKFEASTGRKLVTFRLIHPIYYKGVNYIKKNLGEGKKVYNECVSYARELGFNMVPIKRLRGTKEEKLNMLDTILQSGGEGIVFHYLNGSYCTSENRSKTSYIKLKRSVGGEAGKMGDTIDGWVSGFKMSDEKAGNAGLIGSLEISTNIIKSDGRVISHIIAVVPNIPLEMKKRITVVEDGKVRMLESMYNLVVEVDGQNISKVSRRLTHPRLLRFRADKSKDECIYSEEFIESQID